MVRPLGRPLARRTDTLKDLREEFLQHCEARNLSGRTLEWYADTRRFADWCSDRGISAPSDLRWSDLEAFVLDRVGCIYFGLRCRPGSLRSRRFLARRYHRGGVWLSEIGELDRIRARNLSLQGSGFYGHSPVEAQLRRTFRCPSSRLLASG